ncbi:TonB-dependent receptor [Saccharophagus degradans]|uniref:TonB-dependent receptor n=1 Tax=Saccharophagus degradans TaxID=86304 RepID=UPI001C07FE4E|nr:TonB-dependent receptor [Saccharophagus degradans]MBU2984713.1 TonB-dependent receptor [Saccharophagus degradans]
MYKQSFKHKLLAVSIATAVAASANAQEQQTQAEDNQENILEEVIVTGIRASLQRSMDMKRDAKGVVDGISAEDMGKFPDTNLAESLQRITGVAIDRERGEGSKITVRGFGPDFNIVTFNDRQMPTNGGRSFDFANIASEGISAVEVYKSGRANVATGGIGATVNVKTAKPLDKPGFQAVISGKGVHDPSNRDGASLTPEISGIFSNTFADDTFGISLAASYQDREGGSQSATTQDFYSRNLVTQEQIDNGEGDSGAIAVGDPTAIGFPSEVGEGGIYAIPTNIQYNLDEFKRERTNAQLTMQWRPIDTVTATVDYTYAENAISTEHTDLSAWIDPGCQTRESEWVQEGRIWSPTTYRHVGCATDSLQGVGKFAVLNENNSVGLNIKWDATEKLSFSLDYHDSSGENSPNSKYGSNSVVAVASNNRITTSGYFSADGMPILDVELGERNDYGQIIRVDEKDPNDVRITGSIFGTAVSRMDVKQLQIQGDFEFDGGHTIDFGVATLEVKNRSQYTDIQRNNWSGVGEPGDIADLLSFESIDGVFDSLNGGGDPRQEALLYSWDFDALIERGEDLLISGDHTTNPSKGGGPCGTGYCPTYNFNSDELTTETSSSVYVQGHYLGEAFNRDYNVYAGLRYEYTEVNSEALSPVVGGVGWDVSSNTFLYDYLKDENGDDLQEFTELTGDYDVLLPSIDFDIELIDDLILRASYSKTITRPTYGALKGQLNIWSIGKEDSTAGSGNPQLLPMESDNLDLSIEWYYGEASYASAGIWSKNVTNFIANGTFEDILLYENVTTPYGGALYQEAVEAITGGDSSVTFDDDDINTYFIENYANGNNPYVIITGEGEDATVQLDGASGDPAIYFDVSKPVNQRKTSVNGMEFMVQHTFGETGFGLQANYTIVDGDLDYDLNLNEEQWVVPGMSDTANLVGFYDKNGLEIRLAYNWRDQFLVDPGKDPKFVEEYFQLDLNVSYEINDNVSVFVEGINITEENKRVHGRSSYQVREYAVGHARYNLGARYVF